MSVLNAPSDTLSLFNPVTGQWFSETFAQPTGAQQAAWPAIASGENTLLLAPTGSGKTLASFLVAIDSLMFGARSASATGVRVLYISPLKALGVDIERNLCEPLAGVEACANAAGVDFHLPRVGIRTGDTPSRDRARMVTRPPEILITTPESLFLLLTSKAREILQNVETVIVDEIHSMVPTKRGAHLFLSLERLEDLRRAAGHKEAAQRIGLSATARPLDEVAALLGGGAHASSPALTGDMPVVPRPVSIVDAGATTTLELSVEVPVEDMTDLAGPVAESSESAEAETMDQSQERVPSIWPAIHPRLVALIRAHQSTMIFVNSRRLAERLATAINDLADEELAAAHHGSIAHDTRALIEDRLKRGELPAIVATSSLELGIDMGAVDLVVQIESPPSIASGLQRIGRAGHQVGAISRGVIMPKFRGDLLAAAAVTSRMQAGLVEESRYPRNPLDVLAQQIVATVAMDDREADELFDLMRLAAPFSDLPRVSFDAVLDLLSGRYPSDEFAELRPRITWDRVKGTISARKGAQRIAIANAGTIPDRGLYGVFLNDVDKGSVRVGELDEEMVFETSLGDVFLLGASSWRVTEITHDRVLVVPAPGQPGRMPFWRGDGPGRPLEFGQAIGELTRELCAMTAEVAQKHLIHEHSLDEVAARNLVKYLADQREATVEVPTDRTIVIESFVDEVGDWRTTIHTPFGARVHAPWATAVAGRLREQFAGDVDYLWSDDGIVFRFPESDSPPDAADLVPGADEIDDLVTRELGSTALFAARFRENAGRSLLLPRRMPGKRTPLWLQRRKSADLLAVAARYDSFPVILETYRECLRDVFDLAGLRRVLADVNSRAISVHIVESTSPSPFAASLLFSYVGNFIYNGDAPLAERRAQTLALDHVQLRELLGDAELRELLDADVVDLTSLELQRLDGKMRARDADEIHELLFALGDLALAEILQRTTLDESQLKVILTDLANAGRITSVTLGGENRLIAAEDAARYRDALGCEMPDDLADDFLEPVDDPFGDLVSRYARTHGPFQAQKLATRFATGIAQVEQVLARLADASRVIEGEFAPGGSGREWCDNGVLRIIKRRSLAKLRSEVEPVDATVLARFLPLWHGLDRPRRGLDALLDVVEQLQGIAIPASSLEEHILPARLPEYQPRDLDELMAAGEIVWRGVDSLGTSDGRIALYLADTVDLLVPEGIEVENDLALRVLAIIAQRGAIFFEEIVTELDAFPADALKALWELVWAGEVTNDTLSPLRSLGRKSDRGRRGSRARRGRANFRTRRVLGPAGSEGRWSLLRGPDSGAPSATAARMAQATLLLERHGVLTRESISVEDVAGSFSAVYPVLKSMEEVGKLRRGYFIEGLGAAQFAVPGAEDRLRERVSANDGVSVYVLAATDPANVYGAAIPWPQRPANSGKPTRSAGARVVIVGGELVAWLSRKSDHLLTWMPAPDSKPGIADVAGELVNTLMDRVAGQSLLLNKIDGSHPARSPLHEALLAAGFRTSGEGVLFRRESASAMPRGRRLGQDDAADR